MSLNISSKILSLPGQTVEQAQHDLFQQELTLYGILGCRYRAINPVRGQTAVINYYMRTRMRAVTVFPFKHCSMRRTRLEALTWVCAHDVYYL